MSAKSFLVVLEDADSLSVISPKDGSSFFSKKEAQREATKQVMSGGVFKALVVDVVLTVNK